MPTNWTTLNGVLLDLDIAYHGNGDMTTKDK